MLQDFIHTFLFFLSLAMCQGDDGTLFLLLLCYSQHHLQAQIYNTMSKTHTQGVYRQSFSLTKQNDFINRHKG